MLFWKKNRFAERLSVINIEYNIYIYIKKLKMNFVLFLMVIFASSIKDIEIQLLWNINYL